MDRATRNFVIRTKHNAKIFILYLCLAAIAISFYVFFVQTPNVAIIEKSINCIESPCTFSVTLQNNSHEKQTGYIKVDFLQQERASSNMGPNDGFVHRTFHSMHLNFSLNAQQSNTINIPYRYQNKSPLVITNVVQ
ncbi:hypothetical protein A3765_22905 [Oleiphilus sp. HI0130]|nr:hypothetical protein A3750_06880 [Oleiphilus sp. HI0079]KZZ43651.1 hypothetical protein A3758_15175 [Oleiphilus sp. HI0118]KZZ77822.1 hypothetical protein A3765_22905 [Oleiphilus sp. HI0130]KZZ82405.1 hypothetical protein A3767_00140 [Oleiphilus sp. HI0133]